MDLLISYYVILLLAADISQGISINSVLRLRCKGCMPKPNQCCIGTAVSPKYVLTSNYCAQTCQAAERDSHVFRKIKIHIDPYPKTYVIGHNFNGPNTVAFLEMDTNVSINYRYVDFFAESVPSTTGLEALMPILLNDTLQFRRMTTRLCDKNFDFEEGYYVCAVDEFYNGYDVPQGTPLFANEQFLGVLGIQGLTTNPYSQIRFIAIAPVRHWIQYQLKSNLINNKDEHSQYDEYTLLADTRRNLNKELTSKPISHKSQNRIAKKPLVTKAIDFETRPRINETSKTQPKGCNCSCATEVSANTLSATDSNGKKTTSNKNQSNSNNKTNIITDNQANVCNNKTDSSLMTAKRKSPTPQSNQLKSRQNSKLPKAMEWFNNVRNRIKTDNSLILILRTTTKPKPRGQFIDLT